MAESGYELLWDGYGRMDTSQLAAFVLRGEDRVDWLQGQATNDIRLLSPENPISFCLGSPTGQIEAIVDAWTLADGILMTCDHAVAPAVRRRVEQMVVLEDVTLEDGPWRLVSIQGARADDSVGGLGDASLTSLPSFRSGPGGWDVWGPAESIALLESRVPMLDSESVEIGRIEAGIPAFGRDVTPKTLPPELGSAFERRHVSYQKGCYVGQEILMRIFSRGHTNRTWSGLIAANPMEAGAVVTLSGQAVGAITTAAISPALGPIAAATLRHEAAQPGRRVIVRTDAGEVEAEVRAMPLRGD